MPQSSNYSFYRYPRFSANHLAEYLSASNANHRERVVRSAKFPKKPSVVAYAPSKRAMQDFLGGNSGDLGWFDDHLRHFEARRRREPEGWMRDEMRRNIDAIVAFKRTFSRGRARRYQFVTGPIDLTMKLGGVRINTRLDVGVTETDENSITYSGGCVLFIAKTDTSRRNIEDRRTSVAATIHWALETSNPNIESLPRLCMSFDVFGNSIIKAPKAIDRLRGHMESACREAASSWDRIEPPADYDGPPWQ